ncbi:cobalt ABC transporter permease [Halobacteriales archaeon SW_7_65_23]|nr:MAG: cobalt ABC transporter permease [Halobacteriales archaeon SW_7_65_23]
MLTYTPGETLAHRLDPRGKLAVQFAFAIAVFAGPAVPWLPAMLALAVGCLLLAGLSVWQALRAYWVVLLVLLLGPVLGAVTLGPPWIQPERGLDSLRSVVRVVPVLFVSAAFVHSTPVRETRAAIQRTVPGRFGQLLGVGVALTFRFIPVVREDLRRIREATLARGGERRPLRDRVGRITTLALARSMNRADRLSVALQARCFAWNPTLPRLSFAPIDYAVLALAAGLALSPLLWL